MTTYYISPYGADTNNGLGPDPTHATNKPWKSAGTVLGSAGVLPGDTVYFGPGIYYQGAAMNPPSSIASVASPSTFEGDPLNKQGFKDGSGGVVPPGLCWITTRSAADAKLAYSSSANLLTPNNNGVKGLTFRHLVLEGKHDNSGTIMTLNPATNSDIILEDCRLIATQVINIANAAPTATRNWTLRRCIIICSQVFQSNVATAAATADADLAITVEHSKIYGRLTQDPFVLGTSSGNLAGGIRFKHNTVMTPTARSISLTALRVSTVTPIRVEGNLVIAQGVLGGTAGQVVSDGWNLWVDTVSSSNFTKSGNDKSFGMLDLFEDDLVKWGLAMPQFGFLGWTPDADNALRFSGGGNTSPDFRGRTARPWATGPSMGAIEVGDIGQDTGSQISLGGANSLKINGAGEVSLFLPVTAVATTITIVTKSSLYGGANYPQAIVEANPAIGVTQQTSTAADGTEQTLTIGPFTPSADGVIELRLISRSSSGTSATFFDILTVSP